VGAENAFTSRDLRILVEETAQPVASSDADVVVGRHDGDPALGWSLAEGPVWTAAVVVIDILAEDVVVPRSRHRAERGRQDCSVSPVQLQAARPARHAPGDLWFADETYLRVAGRRTYLYRAIDQYGQVIDVLLSARRDLAAARRFFTRALRTGTVRPRSPPAVPGLSAGPGRADPSAPRNTDQQPPWVC
jgi:hypothetical protein